MSLRTCAPGLALLLCPSCFVDESIDGSGSSSTPGDSSSGSTTMVTGPSTTTSASSSSTTGGETETTAAPAAWRIPLDVDVGTDDVSETDVPVLVRLAGPTLNLSAAAPDGSDLRAVAALDAPEPLPLEIERWDPDGVSLVWVRLPELTSSSQRVWLLYGDTGYGVAPAPSEVWSAGFVGVWHFEAGGDPMPAQFDDSTSMGNAAAPENTAAVYEAMAGQIGDGVDVAGATALLAGPAPEFDIGAEFTLEAWINPDSLSPVDVPRSVISKFDSYRLAARSVDPDDLPYVEITFFDAVGQQWPTADGPQVLPTADWSYLVGTFDGTTLRLYVDGIEVATQTVDQTAQTSTAAVRIGQQFDGRLDEVRLSARARSATWIELQHRSGRGDLVSVGEPEPHS